MSRPQRQRLNEEEQEQASSSTSTSSWLKWGSIVVGAAVGTYAAVEFTKYENQRQRNHAHCENKFITVEELLDDSNLEIGDLIEFLRTKYQHWAVYIGNGEVIHLTNSGRVQKCSLKAVAEGSKCRINNHSVSAQSRGLRLRGTPQQIVEYAKSRIGQPYTYHVERLNCEHFATECAYGTGFSEQENMLQGAVLHRLAANATAAIRTFE